MWMIYHNVRCEAGAAHRQLVADDGVRGDPSLPYAVSRSIPGTPSKPASKLRIRVMSCCSMTAR